MTIPRKIRNSVVIFLSVLLALSLWVFVIEPSSLTVHKETLHIPNWSQEHQGMKVAVLSDLHIGSPFAALDKLKRVVDQTNAEKPDIVVILGDFVITSVIGGKFVEPEPIAEVLKGLSAPLGVFAILGNHDWWYNGQRVTAALSQIGIVVLNNEARRVEYNGKPFWIDGVADKSSRKPDIDGSLEKVPTDEGVIIITHSPDIFPDIPSRVSLTLAGHTHGGQVNIPFIGRPVVPSRFGQRYAAGHIVEDGRHLFVTTGIGTSIFPVRFRVPPEVVILTLMPQ